jgi:two-component sensor histidine kinase
MPFRKRAQSCCHSSQDAVSGPRAIVALHEEDIMTELASTLSIPQERVLLQELNHRISNEFFSAMSLVSLTAARSSSDEVKVALSGVTELLRHYAEVHQALQSPQDDARIDAATYLSKLCLSIRRSKLDQLKIDLVLAAPPLVLQSDECWLLGMIVYELITNAARHAFAGKNGQIRVELLCAGAFVQCKVLDNGAAPANVQRGSGLKIVGELIKALDGRFEQKFGTAGSTSILTFPYSERTARPREQRLRRERHCGK